MTLKEKFVTMVLDTDIAKWEYECEKIADDYAIEFLNWCSSEEATDVLVKLIEAKELKNNPEGKDLLEIFKKEKGL